jgi:hypothetical protein
MTDLNELFKSTLSETLVYQTSELFGESIESTGAAVNSIFPALLGAVVMKGRTDGGAREILEYLSGNNINGDILQDLPTLLTGGPEVEVLKANGADILKFLVGDNVNGMIDTVASNNGLRTSSASSLLKIVATLMMTAIARVAQEKNLNASGLRDLLISQTESVRINTPQSLSAIVGITNPHQPEKSAHGSLEGAPQFDDENKGSMLSKLLPWIVLLIAALGLFYFLEKGSNPPVDEMQKIRMDSIENARKADSVRNQLRLDSIANAAPADTLRPDTISN